MIFDIETKCAHFTLELKIKVSNPEPRDSTSRKLKNIIFNMLRGQDIDVDDIKIKDV